MVDEVHSVVVWAGSSLKGRGAGKRKQGDSSGKGSAGKDAKNKGKKGKGRKSETPPDVQQRDRSGGRECDRSDGRELGIS